MHHTLYGAAELWSLDLSSFSSKKRQNSCGLELQKKNVRIRAARLCRSHAHFPFVIRQNVAKKCLLNSPRFKRSPVGHFQKDKWCTLNRHHQTKVTNQKAINNVVFYRYICQTASDLRPN